MLGHACSHESAKVTKIIKIAKGILNGISTNVQGKESGKRKDEFLKMQAKLGELLTLTNKVGELEAAIAEVLLPTLFIGFEYTLSPKC